MATPVPKAVREERRLVTCMFVDVVGSTELTTRLGAERLKRELGAAFAELSAIITSHGGTVEKYVGDAIYALFGAPIAHEDDPARALRAAEALRQWAAAGPSQRVPFSVRVGVETGEAVIDVEAAASTKQQMSVGPVVNIAARLQQRAEPGEVLVGPTAREATDGVAELEPLAEVDLKGIGRLPVWRLVRVGVPTAAPLAFVGRDAELGLLAVAHQRATKGRSVLAVVSGPPGQGKTRLVQEFLRDRADGSHVIATRCRPAQEVGVFAPVRQMLGVTTLDALAEQVGRLCTDDVECERVVAGLAESAGIATSRSLTRLPAAEREDEIVQAWRRYLGILGTDRLVVLAIDDIHWADPSLVRLVDRLTFGGPRLLVVATARPEFAEASGIRPSGDRFFIELEGLEPDEARRLAIEAGREDDRVVERAEGNPLFIVELARARAEREDLPLTLQGALGARLDELPPPDRALLSAAAVAGERFTAGDAAFLAQREVTDAGRALARLADLHFLDLTEDGYRFHHGLVRDVAYGRLLSAERMRAHARYARERVHPDDAASLAYHWWEALRPPDAEWVWADDPDMPAMRREAFHAHLAAGRRHAEHFAVEQAIDLLQRALALADDDASRAQAEHALGVAHGRVLRQDDAWAHLKKALTLYERVGRTPVSIHVDLVNMAQSVGAFHHRPDDAEVAAIADRGANAARAAGDLALVSRVLQSRASYLVNRYPGEPERGEPFAAEAVTVAEASGDANALYTGLRRQGAMLAMQGRIADSLEVFGRIERLATHGDSLERMNLLRFRGRSEFLAGELDAAERTVTDASSLAETMGPHNRTHAWAGLSDVLVARGDWKRAVELGQRTARLVREEKASAFCRAAVGILRDGAVAHALRGERDEAIALLRAIPEGDVEGDVASGAARALLGFPTPEIDEKLSTPGPPETMIHAGRWSWTEWLEEVFRAVILRRADEAERALAQLAPFVKGSPAIGALARDVGEIAAELRRGPPATYGALRTIGFVGWIEILKRRVDAEY
jgi:class 3 adenylate cyclase/tetratricopeptide (TPR) repeat protein